MRDPCQRRGVRGAQRRCTVVIFGVGLRRFRFPLSQQSSLEHHHVQHPSHLIIKKKLGIQHIRHQRIYKVESASPILGARNIKISNHDRSEAENLRDSFAHLATVEYHTTSRIRMGVGSCHGWLLQERGRRDGVSQV